MRLLSISFLCLSILTVSNGYRLLGIFPFTARSHFMMFEHLMKGLARKGHQVDVISTFPMKKPQSNYTDIIVLPMIREFVNNFSYNEMNDIVTTFVVTAVATLGGNDVCEHLGNPELQKLLRNPPNDPPYDAILMEVFGANCFTIFGHVWKIPIIGASSSILYPWSNGLIANPENLAFVPNNLLPMNNQMNFFERLYNFVHTTYNKIYFNYLTSEQDNIIRKHLGPGFPSVREMERNISLILSNSHVSINGMRPMTPALVEVGGLHVQDDHLELSKPLEKWMNDSKEGFIYFTFGSMITIESFPSKYLNIFYKSLGKIAPVRVLMKIPNPKALPPGLPSNIRTEAWMPQIKILKHPNIKAFITHGGLMGTQEAIHCGVPLIGIPLFADQFINIETYALKKFAIKLDLDTLTEEEMDNALREILTNPIYRNTAKEISAKFLDRPMSPIDTANYWVEYVIRQGADSLKSPAMDLTWWQIQLLDIYLFILSFILIISYAVFTMIKSLIMVQDVNVATTTVSRAKKIS